MFNPCRTVTATSENMRLNLSDEGEMNFVFVCAVEGSAEAMYLKKRWRMMAMLRRGTLFLNVRYCASLLSYNRIEI